MKIPREENWVQFSCSNSALALKLYMTRLKKNLRRVCKNADNPSISTKMAKVKKAHAAKIP